MILEEKHEGDAIRILICGRVDVNSSQELLDAILKAFQKINMLTLDFAELEYISSAGLRSLFLGHKTALSKGGEMRIINVNEDVMEILEDTGFIDLLNVEE